MSDPVVDGLLAQQSKDRLRFFGNFVHWVICSACLSTLGQIERLSTRAKNISIVHFCFLWIKRFHNWQQVRDWFCFGEHWAWTVHHGRKKAFVCVFVFVFVPYFATWVPIITSPSFMRTLLNGLERQKCIFFVIRAWFCSVEKSVHKVFLSDTWSYSPHVWVDAEKHSFQEHLWNKKWINTHSNNRCFSFSVCDSVKEIPTDWKYFTVWDKWRKT